ncbi:hypothetical protein RKD49_005390 [Streptomyces glaucescens]
MRDIALIGKAQSGKDTAALWLFRNRAYTRLAFADPLKEMALSVNPLIPLSYGVHGRLADLVRDVGWDYAKTNYPEARRLLQQMGQTVRECDEDFWLNVMRRKLDSAKAWNMPVVVTDVRYRNEADMLRRRGFKLVRIVRPGIATMTHASETDLDDYPADVTLTNGGTLDDLYRRVAEL